jgi:hypothetical protein
LENQKRSDRFGDPDVDGRIISKLILRKRREGVDWIHEAVGTDIWRAAANTVINLRVP